MLIILFLAACFLAYSNGANDNFKGVAMSKEELSRVDEKLTLETDESRRDFLDKFSKGIFGGLIASGVVNALAPVQAKANMDGSNLNFSEPFKPFDLPPELPGEDGILRMMRDIQRALKKPIEQRHWKMVIDLRKCVGCDACSVSCAAENKLPPGVVYRPVIQQEIGAYPNVGHVTLPRPCMHCDEPPCVPVCPAEATWKRPDGIVVVDYDQCIGCRYCLNACPYDARYVNGKANIIDKCIFCADTRLARGENTTACQITCPAKVRIFGDLDDPNSEISQILKEREYFTLKPEKGTKPKLFYLK